MGDDEASRWDSTRRMPKKPSKIEIVQQGDERFLLKEYDDGREERVPIAKLRRKPPRYPPGGNDGWRLD